MCYVKQISYEVLNFESSHTQKTIREHSKAVQNLNCKWIVKLALNKLVYKIFIKGTDFGTWDDEIPKLSGKIENFAVKNVLKWSYFFNLFEVKNDGEYIFKTAKDEPHFMGTFSGTEITIDFEGKCHHMIWPL